MKTLKNSIIIAGIIVALFSLTAHAAEKPTKELKSTEKAVILKSMGIDKAFEKELIEDYLKEQKMIEVQIPVASIRVYNEKDELVYEGSSTESQALLFVHSADFLMEYQGISYFRLHNK